MVTFNHKIKWLFTIYLVFSMTANAAHHADRGWYFGGFIGTNLKANGNTRIPSIASKPPLTSEPVYQNGTLLQLTVGNQLSQNFRVEGMLSYQNLPIDKINDAIGAGTVTDVDHSYTRLFSLFVNGYYDFRFNHAWVVYPYIGIGGGYVKVKNMIKPTTPIPVAPGLFFTKKELNYDTLGYQGIFGITYLLTKNMNIDFNYTYLSTIEKEVTGFTNLGQDSYQTKQKITDNMISLGLRYYFI